MTPLSFILLSIPATVLLLIVACYVEAWRGAGRPASAPLASARNGALSEAAEVPAWETFAYWWSRTLRPLSIIAVIAAAIQPVLLLSNAYILAQTLSLVFDIQAETLFTVSLFGGSYPVNAFTLGAVIVTLAQMVSAAIAAAEVPGRRHCFIRWCGGCALVLLAIVEICLNVDRTVISGGSRLECVLSGVLAAALVVTESAIGCLILDYLVVPLVLSILWGSSNLARSITRRVSH